MFDFLSIKDYLSLYFNIVLFITFLVLIQSFMSDLESRSNQKFSDFVGYSLLVFSILFIGFRPVSGHYFGDMEHYNEMFRRVQLGEDMSFNKDYLFNYLVSYSAKIMSADYFFVLVDFIYIIPIYIFSKKYFGNYWFLGLLAYVTSFSFFTYGTNGLRNGIGTSLFILGLAYFDKKIIMYIIFAIAFGFHNSIIIPIAAYIVTLFIKNPKYYFYIWLACIPLSLLAGTFFHELFGGLGFEDNRIDDYLNKKIEGEEMVESRFRWDFLLYSFSAIAIAYYYIIKRRFKDSFYDTLFGIYAIGNAFWILVIRANFTNRFAYLSWFLLPAIIIYPLLKVKFFEGQYRIISIMIFLFYLFTYFMYIITM